MRGFRARRRGAGRAARSWPARSGGAVDDPPDRCCHVLSSSFNSSTVIWHAGTLRGTTLRGNPHKTIRRSLPLFLARSTPGDTTGSRRRFASPGQTRTKAAEAINKSATGPVIPVRNSPPCILPYCSVHAQSNSTTITSCSESAMTASNLFGFGDCRLPPQSQGPWISRRYYQKSAGANMLDSLRSPP